MVRREPWLVAQPPEAHVARLEELGAIFGGCDEMARRVVGMHPSLLLDRTPRKCVERNLQALKSLLPNLCTNTLVRRCPALLWRPDWHVRETAAELRRLTPRKGWAQVVKMKPNLLLIEAPNLKVKVRDLYKHAKLEEQWEWEFKNMSFNNWARAIAVGRERYGRLAHISRRSRRHKKQAELPRLYKVLVYSPRQFQKRWPCYTPPDTAAAPAK